MLKAIQKLFQHDVSVLFLGVITLLTIFCTTTSFGPDPNNYQELPNITQTIQEPPQYSPQDSIRDLLVQHTDEYIKRRFPKSKVTGKALVEACEKHNFDICFALAQGEIESGLGSAGKASKTNSPWNVGAWDGRSVQEMNKKGFSYSHPDQSIEPYIELVKTKYLGLKRTIHDLMKRYVTLGGLRYASDPNYERKLKSTYQRICKNTGIDSLQMQLNEL